MKKLITSLGLLLLSSCATTLPYNKHILHPEKKPSLKTKILGKRVTAEGCTRIFLFLPLTKTNVLKLESQAIHMVKGADALYDTKLESDFFTLGIYHAICFKLSGIPVKIEKH